MRANHILGLIVLAPIWVPVRIYNEIKKDPAVAGFMAGVAMATLIGIVIFDKILLR